MKILGNIQVQARFFLNSRASSIIEIHKQYFEDSTDNVDKFEKIFDNIADYQQRSGEIPNYHTAALLSLVRFKPDSTQTQNAVRYFLDNYDRMGMSELATGVRALHELNFQRYQETHPDMIHKLDDQLHNGLNNNDFKNKPLTMGWHDAVSILSHYPAADFDSPDMVVEYFENNIDDILEERIATHSTPSVFPPLNYAVMMDWF